MRWPALQPIKDVRRVHNGGTTLTCLIRQKSHEVGAAQDIQVNGDLIKQEHRKGAQQPDCQLYAAALTIRDSVHAPVWVNVQDAHQPCTTLRISTRHGVKHAARRKVTLCAGRGKTGSRGVEAGW